ncbi:ATP-binding protein [Pseudonocardia sp. D17]|uniref:ATP-binding protein n=1 Tax=Pseudonocardia sp. D17 TaxID=882661 RepID=UPI002B3DEEC9|nr:hypothetical protein PSD17_01780 [Pseudonocardia sp. D17]
MVSKFAVGGGDEFARRTWPAEVGRLRLLRNEVRCWLEALGYGLAMVDDLVLAVNEAATNAMEHAYVPPRPDSTVDVEFWIDGDALRIVVRDHGQWQPPGPPSGRGMGIPMMNQLVDTVTISPSASGTVVHLRQTLPEPAALPRWADHVPAAGRFETRGRSSPGLLGRQAPPAWRDLISACP